MPPQRKRPLQCEVCNDQAFKYTCPHCSVVYCSVICFKKHKEASCQAQKDTPPAGTTDLNGGANGEPEKEETLADPIPLRPLTSLKWPYIPEESAYPDPLKRDDPKTLQLSQYEAIATSPAIRKILSKHKNLPGLLTSIDKLRGPDREYALQEALGVTAPHIDDQLRSPQLNEETLALRQLAEAIEASVRGGNQSALGLDWGDS